MSLLIIYRTIDNKLKEMYDLGTLPRNIHDDFSDADFRGPNTKRSKEWKMWVLEQSGEFEDSTKSQGRNVDINIACLSDVNLWTKIKKVCRYVTICRLL
jgi:hypothetical protein